MEFKITTDLSQLPESVEFNADELKAELAPKLEYYKNLVVTPDAIREAKDDRAKLNKLRTTIDTKRKKVKAACMAPYEAFDRQCKEILAMIDEPILAIDSQIKSFDEQERQEKYDRLKQHFDECMNETDIPIVFDRILNPKWSNKGMKREALEKEIGETVMRIQSEAEEIRQLYENSPHLTAVLECYLAGYDKGAALAYAANLVRMEQAHRVAQKPQSAPEPEVVQFAEPVSEPPAEAQEQLISGRFEVTTTKDKLIALRNFMVQNAINYRVVKER